MAKAKQTKVADAPKAAPAPEPQAQSAKDISAKLRDMLNQSAKDERGDANVDENVPQRKIAGGRATWSGTMVLPPLPDGRVVQFAVNTCTATDDESFERHTYHSETCKNRLKQGDMTCSGCGEKLPRNGGVKGVESDGEIVFVSDEELAKLVPMNDKTMRITEYVTAGEIDPIYFESTEFLYAREEKGGNAAQVTTAALEGMLRKNDWVAKGIRVKRGKEQYFVVRPYNSRGLTINLIRAEYEVRDAATLWGDVETPEQMVELFTTVSEPYKMKFTPAKRDQFHANANKLVADKKAGVTTECPTPEPERKGTDDLLAALKAAVAAKAGK